MIIVVTTYEEQVSNPYYDLSNRNMEPRCITEVKTIVEYVDSNEYLVQVIQAHSKWPKANIKVFEATPISYKLNTKITLEKL